MIADVYKATKDKVFLSWAIEKLKKEYLFWDSTRKAENGLNHYSASPTLKEAIEIINRYHVRTGILRESNPEYWGVNILAEAESGWDFNARFSGKCHEYNAIDLNSLLYFNERFIATSEQELQLDGWREWDIRATKRKALMDKYLLCADGIYYDYSYADDTLSTVKSCASFMPYFVGLTQEKRGAENLLKALELPFGMSASEPHDGVNYQWGYKNGWACLQLIVVEGLHNCGLQKDAQRIAKKYTSLVEETFQQTGALWEKYNVMEGNKNAVGEYGTPEMLGWTAGVYLALENYLTTTQTNL
jgi:alpha,alpha-trehalase